MDSHYRFIIGLFLLALVTGLFQIAPVSANHGWGWATDEEFEITGSRPSGWS